MPPLIFRIPAFVLLALQGVLRTLNLSQEADITIKQEFMCLGSQVFQLPIAL